MNNKENFKEKFLEIMSQTTEANPPKEAVAEEEAASMDATEKSEVMSDSDIQEMLKEKLKEKLQEKNMSQDEELAEESAGVSGESMVAGEAANGNAADSGTDTAFDIEALIAKTRQEVQETETDTNSASDAEQQPIESVGTMGLADSATESAAAMAMDETASLEFAQGDASDVVESESEANGPGLESTTMFAASPFETQSITDGISDGPITESQAMEQTTETLSQSSASESVAAPMTDATGGLAPMSPHADTATAVSDIASESAAEAVGQDDAVVPDQPAEMTQEIAIPTGDSSQPQMLKIPVKTEESLAEVSVITAETTIAGQITTRGHVQVDGEINGNLKAAGDVTISGKVSGDIEGDNLDLAGCSILGNLSATGAAKIGSEVTLQGDVVAQNLQISGSVKGNVLGVKEVQLSETALIEGSLSTDQLAMSPGAKLKGMVSVGQK